MLSSDVVESDPQLITATFRRRLNRLTLVDGWFRGSGRSVEECELRTRTPPCQTSAAGMSEAEVVSAHAPAPPAFNARVPPSIT